MIFYFRIFSFVFLTFSLFAKPFGLDRVQQYFSGGLGWFLLLMCEVLIRLDAIKESIVNAKKNDECW